jgi:hypothetical protein
MEDLPNRNYVLSQKINDRIEKFTPVEDVFPVGD